MFINLPLQYFRLRFNENSEKKHKNFKKMISPFSHVNTLIEVLFFNLRCNCSNSEFRVGSTAKVLRGDDGHCLAALFLHSPLRVLLQRRKRRQFHRATLPLGPEQASKSEFITTMVVHSRNMAGLTKF